jgi:hypothetical protein
MPCYLEIETSMFTNQYHVYIISIVKKAVKNLKIVEKLKN